MLSKANVRGLLAGLGLAGGLVLGGSGCNQAILTAPPGSTIDVTANPTIIPAFGGVSVITAVVYDATGQPVADGTVVQFVTDLGRVDEQGRTNDGVVRVNLVSDGRSGTATVKTYLGGGSAPQAPPTATPTPTGTTAGAPTALAGTMSTSGSSASASTAENFAVVTIGSKTPKVVVITADPRNIAPNAPRYSTLTATVFDEDGNPVPRVPVVFQITDDADFSESLESGGQPVYTDNNGQAKDRLFTSTPRDGLRSTVEVKAIVVTGAEKPLESDPPASIGINF